MGSPGLGRERRLSIGAEGREDLMESWDWRDLLAGIDHVTSSGRRAVVSDAR